METGFENMKQYGEEMIGKFSHKPDGRNGIVISVTKPFVEEICIDCDNDFYREYGETYLHLEPQADHPDLQGYDLRVYYNTQEKCYYRSQWGPTEEGRWGCTWVRTDLVYIRNHTLRYERLLAHFRRCKEIHKGQLCIFTGYAVDPNGNPKRPSTVESMFERHNWYYDPFSFEVKPLDENTIDDFVKETPISKEMTDKMVRHHRSERNKKRWAKAKELLQNFGKTCRKSAQFFGKFNTLFVAIISAIVGSVFMPILKWFLKLFEG